MTNREALAIEVGIQVTEGMLNKSLIDAGLTSSAEYVDTDSVKILKSAMQVLFNASLLKSISEGGYSISFDREAIMARLNYLAKKTGDYSIVTTTEKKPTVRRLNVW